MLSGEIALKNNHYYYQIGNKLATKNWIGKSGLNTCFIYRAFIVCDWFTFQEERMAIPRKYLTDMQ